MGRQATTSSAQEGTIGLKAEWLEWLRIAEFLLKWVVLSVSTEWRIYSVIVNHSFYDIYEPFDGNRLSDHRDHPFGPMDGA